MKHKTALFGVCFGIALILFGGILLFVQRKSSQQEGEALTSSFFALDTMCEVTVYGTDDLTPYRSTIERLGKELDRYDSESDVSKFNTVGSAVLTGASEEVFERSKQLYEQYGGVDVTCGGLISLWGITSDSPRVPSDTQIKAELDKTGFDKLQQDGSVVNAPSGTQLDFGSVAKGYILDRVKKQLDDDNSGCAVISLGSSTLLYGSKPDGEPFRTGIKDPSSPDRLLLKFESGSCFVSTSGGYERYFESGGKRYIHILDLATGRPSESDLASVTVICQDGLKSDFLSTAIFIGGTKGLDRYLEDDSIEVIAIDKDNNIHYSPSLEGRITMTGE